MSWEAGFQAARDAAARAPAAANPATLGEIARVQMDAAALETSFGVSGPWMEATDALRGAIESTAGMSLADLASRAGRTLRLGSLKQQTDEMAELAAGLTPEQQDKVKPFLDVPTRARTIAAERERAAADVSERTYGLSGHAIGFLAGMARQAVDPVNLATMFVGGPLRGPVLPMLAREAGLGAAAQAVQEPAIAAGRAELGLETGFAQSAGNILTAGIGNAGFAGLLRAGAWAFGRLAGEVRAARAAGDAADPSQPAQAAAALQVAEPIEIPAAREISAEDLAAAARLVERDQLVDAIAPVQTAEGRLVHAQTLDAAASHFERGGPDVLARFEERIDAIETQATRERPAGGEEILAQPEPVRIDLPEGSGARIADDPSPAARAAADADASAGGVSSPPAGQARTRRRNQAQARPVSLGRFIAQAGGIRIDEQGDIRHLGINQMFVPGVGMVGRVNGLRLDADLEPMLIEAGYLRRQDPDAPSRDISEEVYAALHDEFVLKRPRYAMPDEVRVADLETARALDQDQRFRDEISAEADNIRARMAEYELDPAGFDDDWINEAAELVVSGRETDWDGALERVALMRELGDDAPVPAVRELAEDLPDFWEDTHAADTGTASQDRGGSRSGGADADRQGGREGLPRQGEALPAAGQAGGAPGGAAGDPTLARLDALLSKTDDPARAKARLADIGRALDAAGDIAVELDGRTVSARALFDEIRADADAADALKACLGQGGGP